ncbi:MAG: glycosyltransferase family 4 protein [Bacteroidetes bacterium]|nr:glycosyltransferase family 4 protein [Bacteroidota bacterium]
MNILIVTTRVPFPPFRGDKLKIFNIAQRLSKNHSVKILCLSRSRENQSDLDGIKKAGPDAEILYFPWYLSVWSLVIRFFSGIPLQVLWYFSPALLKRLEDITKTEKIDIVYFHLIRSGLYGDAVSDRILKVIDYTDSVSLYLQRMIEIESNLLKKFIFEIEKNRILNYEKVADKFDQLFICSPVDKVHLEKTSKLTVGISELPNGVDLTTFVKISGIIPESNRIIFTGNMPYFPNQDAALFTVHSIMPLVWKQIPSAKLYLVGQKPPRSISNLSSDKVIVTGFVEDIRTEYLKSTVTIAPVRFGAGTLNKVIESLVLGVPVISSPKAIAGLPEILKPYILMAESENEFADQICKVLQNPVRYREIALEGEKTARLELDWTTIVGHFEQKLQTLHFDKLAKLPK